MFIIGCVETLHVVCNDSLRKARLCLLCLGRANSPCCWFGWQFGNSLVPATFSPAPNCSSLMFSGNWPFWTLNLSFRDSRRGYNLLGKRKVGKKLKEIIYGIILENTFKCIWSLNF